MAVVEVLVDVSFRLEVFVTRRALPLVVSATAQRKPEENTTTTTTTTTTTALATETQERVGKAPVLLLQRLLVVEQPVACCEGTFRTQQHTGIQRSSIGIQRSSSPAHVAQHGV